MEVALIGRVLGSPLGLGRARPRAPCSGRRALGLRSAARLGRVARVLGSPLGRVLGSPLGGHIYIPNMVLIF